MSDEHKKSDTNLPVPSGQVGYGKPPVEHRFQKGHSGNPKGRPRGARNRAREPLDAALEPTSRMILEEAYRPVSIREGEHIIELPAIQAVMRAMGVSAMKDNRLAQKMIAGIVQKVEADHRAHRTETLEAMQNYQIAWRSEIERCARLGLPDPAPIPHPDDVILNYRNGVVKIEGPQTREEKADWDKRLARRDQAQAEVTEMARLHKRARSPRMKAIYLEDLHFEQRIFDIINDMLPARYKTTLANRSRAAGASREGDGREYVDGLVRQHDRKRRASS